MRLRRAGHVSSNSSRHAAIQSRICQPNASFQCLIHFTIRIFVPDGDPRPAEIRALEAVLSEDTLTLRSIHQRLPARLPHHSCAWNGPHLAAVPKRLSKSTVPPTTGMRVGGSPRVYCFTVTVFLSALRLIRTGSSGLPLFDAVRSSA